MLQKLKYSIPKRKTGKQKKREKMVIKHGRIIQKKHAWSQHNFLSHPEMNDTTLPPDLFPYSPENHPEDFQKSKILVLSNAILAYRTSSLEGKQYSSAPEARECFFVTPSRNWWVWPQWGLSQIPKYHKEVKVFCVKNV